MLSLTAPVDPRPLALARIAVGVTAVLNFLEAYMTLMKVADGRVSLPQWAWMPPVTHTATMLFLSVGILAAVALTFGVVTRLAAAFIAAATAFMFAWEQQTFSNHMTLCAWLALWLVFSRSDAAWSLRARATGRREVQFRDQILLMTQLSVCYLFAALVKIHPEFLSGRRLEEIVSAPGLPAWAFAAMGWGTVVVELTLAVGLWVPRLRVLAMAAGIGLHVSIPVLMSNRYPLVSFSLLCLALYPLFLAKRWESSPQPGEWRFDSLGSQSPAGGASELGPGGLDTLADARGSTT